MFEVTIQKGNKRGAIGTDDQEDPLNADTGEHHRRWPSSDSAGPSYVNSRNLIEKPISAHQPGSNQANTIGKIARLQFIPRLEQERLTRIMWKEVPKCAGQFRFLFRFLFL